MNRPDSILTYEEIDLKLGIKSSLPKVKSTLALAILIWECLDGPAEIIYSEQNGDQIVMSKNVEQHAISYLKDICTEERISQEDLIIGFNQNLLFKSQIESLMVAFELIWRLAKVSFVDTKKIASIERTGGIRFPKKLTYSANIDIVHSVICMNQDSYNRVLLAWAGFNVKVDRECEKNLFHLLTVLSEHAVFKLSDVSKDVIFNQNCIYRKLLKISDGIDISGEKEAKGSLRILKSMLNEGMNPYLQYSNGTVTVKEHNSEKFGDYQRRVDIQLWLDSTNAINSEKSRNYNKSFGDNILLYGVPGCGKSHTIKDEYCNDERFMERVVFHPDYTYSDFVGQILPSNIDGHISYPFVPGPFTRILKKAVNDQENNYFLIIEELNRGNAPAIFGEVFQLLDRVDGESEYGINNADIALEVYSDSTHQVKLPKNLFILATMNTADQNVFTLDTAFKRRWRMRSITNDINKCFFGDYEICGSNVSWKSFLKTINDMIIESSDGNISSEDKRLGAYFVQPNELEDVEAFSEKVLMYLWNDVFKYEHEKVFNPQYKTLEQLIDGFKHELFGIFNDTIVFDTQKISVTNVNESKDNDSISTPLNG